MRTPLGSPEVAARAAQVGGGDPAMLSLSQSLGRDTGGFAVLGVGMSRVALLRGGVVYKAPHGEEFNPGAFAKEIEVFGYMARHGLPWCPDFYPYQQHRVMAMPRYRPVDVASWEKSEAKRWAEAHFSDVRLDNFGQRDDGSIVVLDVDQLSRDLVERLDPIGAMAGYVGKSRGGGLGASLLGF